MNEWRNEEDQAGVPAGFDRASQGPKDRRAVKRWLTFQYPGAAVWMGAYVCLCNENFNEKDERPKHCDAALRLSPTASGLAAATFRDPDASSHRSDQGRCATDVCPGALFQA